MFKKLLIVGFAVFTAACVPIPTEPPEASEPPETIEQLADCSGGYLDILPGQSASDPILSSLPAYIDIVGVDSSLEGDTLTATFFLRDIPQDLPVNRKGVENMHLEYMWTVSISNEVGETDASDQAEYTFATFYTAERKSADTPRTIRPFESAVQIMVWKNKYFPEKNETHWLEVPVQPRLIVSHEEHAHTCRPDSRHH